MTPITAVILTFNEEKHIARCILSLQAVCTRICIIDSFSTDNTIEIAKSYGAEVFSHVWENNYAKQLNWGIQEAQIQTAWTMRIDADEYLTEELQQEILLKLPALSSQISGVEFTRKVIYKGRWIRFGGFYPIHLLRLFRTGMGTCEQRLMDEHIVLSVGETIRFNEHVVDENLNSTHWWVLKHNNYARREAADALNQKYQFTYTTDLSAAGNSQAHTKRTAKNSFYNRLPLGIRALAYFVFRFIFQLGFLDHPKVWIFHFMQGLWYRLLVDLNIYEAEKAANGDPKRIIEIVQREWKIEF
jgi:glycosyltransferase involved in cell wall biosynthesis